MLRKAQNWEAGHWVEDPLTTALPPLPAAGPSSGHLPGQSHGRQGGQLPILLCRSHRRSVVLGAVSHPSAQASPVARVPEIGRLPCQEGDLDPAGVQTRTLNLVSIRPIWLVTVIKA